MQAIDIIKSALRKIGSYQSGEPLEQEDAHDCLTALNSLLDSLSTQHEYNFGSQEWILQWVPNKNVYTIGNPLCTELGEPPFIATVTAASPILTGVTNIPADLKVGATLTDRGAVLLSGTTVTAFDAGAQTVTMSAAPLSSFAMDDILYTIPGDFAIPRPIKLSSAYTRFSALDFTLYVQESQEGYNEILYKAQPGPWPIVAWYNNLYPYGVLNVYQTPGQAAELHLFTDNVLRNLHLHQNVTLPPGYGRALEWLLARELWPEYWANTPVSPNIAQLAGEATMFLKQVNARPLRQSNYDTVVISGCRPDAGFVFSGGYRGLIIWWGIGMIALHHILGA